MFRVYYMYIRLGAGGTVQVYVYYKYRNTDYSRALLNVTGSSVD